MSDHQSIREARVESTRPAHSSPLQNEGLGLLNQSRLPEQNRREPNSTLEVPNIFPQQPGRGGDIAGGACTTQNPRCESESRWRPDSQRRTQSGRNWDRDAESQRAKPLETGPNDNYRVQRGDCLEDIARRMLRQESSQNPSRRDLTDATRRILEANPQLRCNPELIRPGMEIKIPKRTDGPPQREPETRRESTNREQTGRERTNREQTNREQPRGEQTNREQTNREQTNREQPRREQTRPDQTNPAETKREPKVPKLPSSDGDRNAPPSTNRDAGDQLESMKKCLESMRRQLEEMQRTTKKSY